MTDLVKELGIFGIIVAAVAWLARTLISYFLSRDIENHKRTLESIFERNLEAFKAQLLIQIKEHEIRFSKLHEKRAEVLQDFYIKLDAIDALILGTFVDFSDWKKIDSEKLLKNVQDAIDCITSAENIFRKNKLYFSASLCEKVDRFFSSMNEPLEHVYLELKGGSYSEDELRQYLNRVMSELGYMLTIKSEIEEKFRVLLGAYEAAQPRH